MAQTRQYCRIRDNGTSRFGIVDGRQIRTLDRAPWSGGVLDGDVRPFSDDLLLTPVEPQKIICVGRNYHSHLGDRDLPVEPGLFTKLGNALIGPGDPVPLPRDAQMVQNEGEMVLVIGRRATDVPVADAADHIFGVTCGHDISVRPWQRGDLQWVRAKSSDGFAPVGPVITTGLDPDDLLLESKVNGVVKQSERTHMLIFDCAEIVSYVSRYLTLEPGDIIFTGTPGTAPDIVAGDSISVSLQGVGVLVNPVVARS